MSARRLRAIVRRVLAEIRRDHPSLALLFIAPIVITGLVTFIVREGEVRLFGARALPDRHGDPGEVLSVGEMGMIIACGSGAALEIIVCKVAER